jgi:ATP-dependent helicase HrpB
MPLVPLPIDDVLPSITASLARASTLVLQAPPGAGKTTRVPPALLAQDWSRGQSIIVLEPRRMAARAAARRIADEQNSRVGDIVGYQVRFDERRSANTRLLVVTEGIFLRRIQSDPFLEGVAAVVFDEFHERNLLSDVALGMVRRTQQVLRPELRIMLMSATLDAPAIAAAMGDCPIIRSEGRAFPVDIRYAGRTAVNSLAESTAAAVERALKQHPGDVLAFLPGVGEIRRTQERLESLARQNDLAVMPLFGDMPPEEQDAVLKRCPQRKVVLATNVAETSLTIEGIRIVVDSGLARKLMFDPESGLDRLELTTISKASAEQRAGRAGRTEPGVCWRLWDEPSQRARPDRETPEIARVDLASAVLTLMAWGEADVLAFPWLEPPAEESVQQAKTLLQRLGALDETDHVTELGQTIARMPAHPRIARLAIEGHRRGVLDRALLTAAFLSERDPFLSRTGGPAGARTIRSRSDLADKVAAVDRFLAQGEETSPWGELHRGGVRTIAQVRDQLRRELGNELGPPTTAAPTEDSLLQAILAAYPDRVAKRRDRGSDRAIMVGGRGVKLAPSSCVTESEFFVCVDVSDAQPDALVRMASSIEREWLDPARIREVDERFFHPTQKQVAARRKVYYEDLILSETPIAVALDDVTAETLFEAARVNWSAVCPEDSAVSTWLNRAQFVAAAVPEFELPTFNDEQREEVLRELCNGRKSFAELRSAPWLHAFKSALTWDQQQAVEREAPERFTVPSGKSFKLDYEPGRPPVLAARIQDLFGVRETPRIARGRVKVLVHLLAPNQRPQQVTDDLPSFWANTYTEVRKELRRRYPKHAWPEDPLA